MKLRILLALALGLVFAVAAAQAEEKGLDNHAKRDPYYGSLKGKKVLAMGFDLTEGWAAIMRRQAKDLGYGVPLRPVIVSEAKRGRKAPPPGRKRRPPG